MNIPGLECLEFCPIWKKIKKFEFAEFDLIDLDK